MRRNYILIGLFIILTVAGIAYFQRQINGKTQDNPAEKTENANREYRLEDSDVKAKQSLTSIDFGNGTVIDSQVTGSNVLEILTKISKEKKFEVGIKEYKFGTMVESINGFSNSKDKYWSYYVNGKAGQISADKFLLKPGDRIEWRYGNN